MDAGIQKNPSLECPNRHPRRVQYMAGNRSDPQRAYPRLHVEMRGLSDTAILVDGRLIENGHTVCAIVAAWTKHAPKFQGAFQSMALTAATKTSSFTKTILAEATRRFKIGRGGLSASRPGSSLLRCSSAPRWRPNAGRGSSYRRGILVQTIGTNSSSNLSLHPAG
jgi:hypothetical protein